MKKVDHEKSPYGALDHIDQIENDLFQMGGILRGESVYYVHGRTVGSASCHGSENPGSSPCNCNDSTDGHWKDQLELQAVWKGGQTQKFEPVLHFFSWFLSPVPFPLLSYAKAIKKVCKSLGITTRHFVHIGRVLGNKELKIMEDDDNLRRTLGNWDPKQNEKAYSNKLPLKTIRRKAGFREAEGLHYNSRVAVIPPTSLTDKVFPCLRDSFQVFTGLSVISPEDDKVAATRFLHFMKVLSEVVIQDATVIFVEHPNRIHHPLFSSVEVFQSNEFQSYVELMLPPQQPSVMPFRFARKDIEYSKSVQTRLINQSFEPDILPPHILGCSDDFNVTLQRIDQYYNSLLEDDKQEAVEWEKWEFLSPMEKDMYQHHITVLKEQRQVLMQTMKQGEGREEGRRNGRIAVSAEQTSTSDEKNDRNCGGGGILYWTRAEENKLMQARSRGMSWENICKGCFKGKRSVEALKRRYYRFCVKISKKTTSRHR
ncbi:centromere DNA-binding like protein [Nitzschia inconspicua]|uniref:Centromere DNA-binding like protein n=1 Tax=Nitzschia inconspicua TaxID=303405 RepID=A0A9K3L9E6_9STRA|nr:centromere DNA-binding like protein [Nitzschia inconspicua]